MLVRELPDQLVASQSDGPIHASDKQAMQLLLFLVYSSLHALEHGSSSSCFSSGAAAIVHGLLDPFGLLFR
jgi:hypothetical protein